MKIKNIQEFVDLIFLDLKNKDLSFYLNNLIKIKNNQVFISIVDEIIKKNIQPKKFNNIARTNLYFVKKGLASKENFFISKFFLDNYSAQEKVYLHDYFKKNFNLELIVDKKRFARALKTQSLVHENIDVKKITISDIKIPDLIKIIKNNKHYTAEEKIELLIELKEKIEKDSAGKLARNLSFYYNNILPFKDLMAVDPPVFEKFIKAVGSGYIQHAPADRYDFFYILIAHPAGSAIQPEMFFQKQHLISNLAIVVSYYHLVDVNKTNQDNASNIIRNIDSYLNNNKDSKLFKTLVKYGFISTKDKVSFCLQALGKLSAPAFKKTINNYFFPGLGSLNKQQAFDKYHTLISEIEKKLIVDAIPMKPSTGKTNKI